MAIYLEFYEESELHLLPIPKDKWLRAWVKRENGVIELLELHKIDGEILYNASMENPNEIPLGFIKDMFIKRLSKRMRKRLRDNKIKESENDQDSS